MSMVIWKNYRSKNKFNVKIARCNGDHQPSLIAIDFCLNLLVFLIYSDLFIMNKQEGIECEICREAFTHIKAKPRILECGHSFCEQCIMIYLPVHKKCFICEMPMIDLNVNSYPVNYELCNLLAKYPTKHPDNTADFNILKGKVEKQAQEIARLEKKLKEKIKKSEETTKAYAQKMRAAQEAKNKILKILEDLQQIQLKDLVNDQEKQTKKAQQKTKPIKKGKKEVKRK